MKTGFFIGLYFIMSSVLMAQYTFNTTSNTYQDLVNPTSLNQGAVWTNSSIYQIYFNFNFEINGQTCTALNVHAGGGLSFPGLGVKELFVVHSPFGGYFLQDKGTTASQSSIDYTISGIVGERILKIQWKNAGFKPYGLIPPNTADFMNYQIWLFEQNNHIEIRFGSSQFDRTSFGQSPSSNNSTLSVKLLYDNCNNMLGLQGAANLPSYWFFNSCVPNYTFISGAPNTGVTYVFRPVIATNINEVIEHTIEVYPNPTTENILIDGVPESFGLENITLHDVTGRIVLTKQTIGLVDTAISLTLENLPCGIYILKLSGKDGTIYSRKIIKQE
ncbi:MAG: T9SS type A sorting domain-containing protein [Aureispira sp.]